MMMKTMTTTIPTTSSCSFCSLFKQMSSFISMKDGSMKDGMMTCEVLYVVINGDDRWNSGWCDGILSLFFISIFFPLFAINRSSVHTPSKSDVLASAVSILEGMEPDSDVASSNAAKQLFKSTALPKGYYVWPPLYSGEFHTYYCSAVSSELSELKSSKRPIVPLAQSIHWPAWPRTFLPEMYRKNWACRICMKVW